MAIISAVRTALIIGCADGVWEEVKAAREMHTFGAIYCVKHAGIFFPEPFAVWATLHPEFMDDFEKQRAALGHPGGYEIVGPFPKEAQMHGNKGNIARRVTWQWPGMVSSAASGIYGAKIALDDGFERIVLAGIPMTPEGGHIVRKKRWQQRCLFLPGLKGALPHLKGRCKSMSGLTQELLGAPTAAWLAGSD